MSPRSRVRRVVDGIVNFGGRYPILVIGFATVLLVACWSYARKLEVRADIMELLPKDSPGFQSFERRLQRVGGRATLTIVCESPDRAANERFIDAVDQRLRRIVDDRAACAARCSGANPRDRCLSDCGADLIGSIESGTKDLHSFFEANKWLYADMKDLQEVDSTLDRQIAIKSGLVEDLLGETTAEHALGLSKFKGRWKQSASDKDDFPSGYFASKDGTELALRIMSTTSGLGGGKDEQLLRLVQQITAELRPATFHPAMKVGFGGDIPNAAAEKESLIREAVYATLIAAVLILGGVIWFYGSPWSLVLVGFPPLFGVGCAYAFATWNYGFVNASGVFLGAIILGNGVNYPIVLYSRYKEFRARGMDPDHARREAVWNAFRAELVGATVASIAYGSLTVTRFRGFNQFGVIGFFGMLLVWVSMIPCLPALIVLVERIQRHLPKWLQERAATLDSEGSRGPVARFIGNATARWPRYFVLGATFVTVVLALKLPSFIKDPWEYNFDKLGSKGARSSGAFQWSAKADRILTGKMNLAGSLVLADRADQVDAVKERILANDAADPRGAMINSITTLNDFLPGPVTDQKAKLEVLERIRDRLTPKVRAGLADDERKTVDEMMPPESLRPLGAEDLPGLLRTRFSERDGTLGTILYVRYHASVARNDGHNLLRMASTIDGVRLPDGTRVDTASRATVFAEMIKSLERDGPLATAVSFGLVLLVVIFATSSWRGTVGVALSLILGVVWMLGSAAMFGGRLNFLNFIALPITFGIGSEYPFNIFDRSRLLGGDVTGAVKLHFGAVALCSYTTTIGYGSLLFADNQALQSFGRFAIAGEIACFAAAVLFLPALLHLIGAHTKGRDGDRADKTAQSAA